MCHLCLKAFRTVTLLRNHVNTHTGEAAGRAGRAAGARALGRGPHPVRVVLGGVGCVLCASISVRSVERDRGSSRLSRGGGGVDGFKGRVFIF